MPLAPLHSEVRELKQHVMPLTPLHSEIRELKELVSALSDEVRRLQTKPTPSKRLRKRFRARLGCCVGSARADPDALVYETSSTARTVSVEHTVPPHHSSNERDNAEQRVSKRVTFFRQLSGRI